MAHQSKPTPAWRSYIKTDLTPDNLLNLLVPELLRLGVSPQQFVTQTIEHREDINNEIR